MGKEGDDDGKQQPSQKSNHKFNNLHDKLDIPHSTHQQNSLPPTFTHCCIEYSLFRSSGRHAPLGRIPTIPLHPEYLEHISRRNLPSLKRTMHASISDLDTVLPREL